MPCVKRMPVRTDDRPGSGCRLDCRHRVNVSEYQSERARQLAAMEHETRNFAGDVALYLQTVTLINFRAWLLGQANPQPLVESFDRWAHLV